MSVIANWLSERLKQIPESSFNTVKHRAVPEKGFADCHIDYFNVPLSGGTGQAILVEPQNDKSIKNKPLIILLHGLGDDCTYPLWHWIKTLTNAGFATLSFDWDGHGFGSHSKLDFQQATRSIPLILHRIYGAPNGEGLAVERAGPPCFLVGHSMGGSLALISAARLEISRYVKGVVVVSPAVVINGPHKFSDEMMSYLNPMVWIKDLVNKIPLYGISGLFPAVGSFKRDSFPLRVRVGIDYVDQARDFAYETFVIREILKKINIPVLWMHGVKDKIVPYEDAAKLMMDIPSSLFSFHDPKRGHMRMAFSTDAISYAANFINNIN